jgi:hypothetical protein
MSAYDSYQRKLNELRVKFWHEINNEREALPFVVEYVKMLEEEIKFLYQTEVPFDHWGFGCSSECNIPNHVRYKTQEKIKINFKEKNFETLLKSCKHLNIKYALGLGWVCQDCGSDGPFDE